MVPTILLSLGLILAMCRVLDNQSYLRGRGEMRRRYRPNHGPDPYERSLRGENKRLMCAAIIFATGLAAKLTIFS